MNTSRSRLFSFMALLLLVATVAGLSCFVAEWWINRCACGNPGRGHNWMHAGLGISAEQEKLLEPVEERYTEQKRHGEEMMRLANLELAQAILEDKQDSERVRNAVDKIHHAMGGLQKATLNHVFEMKTVLTEDQYEKLLQLTAQGLRDISAP